MTYRSSFGSAYGGGRASPFARPGPDRSFSDLFEYVDPNDTSPLQLEDENAPDVVHCKYMGRPFTLAFPPYSISESGVTVQEVRRRIAEKLGKDPRRVRIVYKDTELMVDRYAIKRYGLKQNSEIAVIVTEQYVDYGSTDSQHSSGDDSGSANGLRPPEDHRRPRGLSTVRDRGVEVTNSTVSGDYLHPNGHGHREIRVERRTSKSPSRTKENRYRTSDTAVQQPAPTPTIVSRSPSADPDSAMGKVQALQNEFYDKWLPDSEKFLDSPSSDPTQRDRDYRRLSESIMKHIILAADAIELQGDQNARTERKKVLSHAQEILKKLDAVPKSK